MGNEKAVAKIYVSESIENEKKFYLTKIEKVSSTNGFAKGSPLGVQNSVDDTSTISVADLFAFVKEHDVDFEKGSKHPVLFNPKAVSPLLLNEDGTPKDLFHQTAEDFTRFNTDNPAQGKYDSETPNGIFLKDNDHDIGIGGKKQMHLYGTMSNPLHFADRAEAKHNAL